MSKIEYYDVKNIIPINKALHTESGKVLEMKVLTEGTDSKDVTCNELKDFKWELMEKGVVNLGTVETISLNDIIKEHGEIDYMKVDCEGCEWDLLYEKDLSKVKAIVTEIHGGYMGEDKKEKLINYLTSEFGNKYVYHEEYKYRKNEQGKYVDPNLASSGDHEFIFHRDGTPDLKENLYIRFRVMNPNYGTNPVEYPDIYKNFVSHIKKYVIP
jgi:FkbM family methyltransferase